MRSLLQIIRLVGISTGMAVTISCNNVLASLFLHAHGLNLIFSIGIAALAMLVVAYCFVELSSKFPGAIGIRAFTKAAFGDAVSVTATLFYVGVVVLMGAFEVYLCFQVLQTFVSGWAAAVVLCVLLVGIVFVNMRGYELSISVQLAMTSMVIVMLAVLAAGTTGAAGAQVYAPDIHLIQAVPTALFLFVGVEWACLYVAGLSDYRFRLPVAMAVAIVIIFLIYSALAISLGAQFETQEISSLPLPHVALAQRWSSETGWIAVSLVSLLALLTSFNVGLSGASRILYTLSREGALPRWLSKLDFSTLVPRKAVLAVAAGVIGFTPLVFSDTVRTSLPQLLGIDLCVVYGMTLAAWVRLRRLNGRRHTKPVMPVIVWVTLGGIVVVAIGGLVEGFSVALVSVFALQMVFVRIIAGRREKYVAVA